MEARQKAQRFVSIKWKYLLYFTIVLFAVNFGLSLLSSHSLKKQFDQQQQSQNKQQMQQLLGMLDNSREALIQAAYISHLSINAVPGDEVTLDRFYKNNTTMLVEMDLDYLQFFQQPENFNIPLANKNQLPRNYQTLLHAAFQNEKPITGIFCNTACHIYAVVPLLRKDGSTGILFLSKSVAQLLEDFSSISGSDVALVNQADKRIFAITHAESRQLLVQRILERQHSYINSAGLNNAIQHNDRSFSINKVSLPDDRHQFMVLTDITTRLSSIEQSTRQSMLLGLAGLVFSEIMLFLLLTRPVARVQNLSQHLPLLSANQHQKFREKFHSESENHMFCDELDLLEQTSIQLASQLEMSERDLIWQAEHDSLTGLKNRHCFNEDFTRILNTAIRFNHHGALLYFDLDQFKYINDTSGHQSGDTLLRVVADRLQKIIRNTDEFARLGGDEFAILLPETHTIGAVRMAEKIHETLAQISLPANGYVHKISASIGIVIFPDHGSSVPELLAHGDIAMYQAKDSGLGQHHLFSTHDGAVETLHRRIAWKEIISDALTENRLILHFQPILNLASNRVSHHEALVRILSSDGELLPPGNFIPEAESSGLIRDVDFCVLELALKFLSESGNNQHTIAINLSGKTMNDARLVPTIRTLLARYQVKPERIIFEITETAAVSDFLTTSAIMKQINALGCEFALDDFGIGFSSFYYLKQLPAKYVKIDGAFIRNLPSSKEDQLFVRAITEVIQGLGKKTIAEFVGDDETVRLLSSYGVDYGQGYFIGKPVSDPVIN
ncbi:MAG: EAL domain-containing protein [Chromatiales bacterium]